MKDYYETDSKFILFSEVAGHCMGEMLDTRFDWDGLMVTEIKQKELQELFVSLKSGQAMTIRGHAIDDYKSQFKAWLELRDQGLCK